MDAASLREKAALCLRIARGLSWNNPGRLELLELAEHLDRQAKEFELQNHPAEKCRAEVLTTAGRTTGSQDQNDLNWIVAGL
jgi:hypothetical protein